MEANIKKNPRIIWFFLALLMLQACQKNRLDVDVSDVKCDLILEDFDKDLFASKAISDSTFDFNQVKLKYGKFFEVYNRYIMNFDPQKDSTFSTQLSEFIKHPMIKYLHDTTASVFSNRHKLEGEINEAFRHYKYYYPGDTLPRVLTYISEFGPACYTDQNFAGIGLDMYLGSNFRYYRSIELDFPEYRIKKFRSEYAVRDLMHAMAQSKIQSVENGQLLNRMIYEGKLLYFVQAMMPELDDTLVIGYTALQLKWCEDNVLQMWHHFVEEKMLYSTDMITYNRYLVDGPFTSAPGVPTESAPRIGVWLGWQIVKKYMDANPDITLQQMFDEQDAQRILQQSKFRPK